MTTTMAGGDEWIYVLSQQETVDDAAAETEQAVTSDDVTVTSDATATDAGEDNNSNPPSKNPDDDDETADEDDEESDVEEWLDYHYMTPKQISIEHECEAYMRGFRQGVRASEAFERAVKKGDDAVYVRGFGQGLSKAFERAVKVDDRYGDADVDSSDDTGRGGHVMDNYPYYDDSYGGGGGSGQAPASLGLPSGYDYGYYDRYGFGGLGFPAGANYGPAATGSGYDGYAGYYYGEPYAYGYVSPAAAMALMAAARLYPQLPQRTYFYPAPTPVPASVLPAAGSGRVYPAPPPVPASVRPAADSGLGYTPQPEPSWHLSS